jgi:hypothetical protein
MKFGTAIAMRMPMIRTTIMISTSVKPLFLRMFLIVGLMTPILLAPASRLLPPQVIDSSQLLAKKYRSHSFISIEVIQEKVPLYAKNRSFTCGGQEFRVAQSGDFEREYYPRG